jgi:hypothetical protein
MGEISRATGRIVSVHWLHWSLYPFEGVNEAVRDWNAGDDFFGDEDGEVYWGAGHVDKSLFAFNVNRVERLNDPEHEAVSAEHVQWLWYTADPADDDRMTRCYADDEGAEPVTRCEQSGYKLAHLASKWERFVIDFRPTQPRTGDSS